MQRREEEVAGLRGPERRGEFPRRPQFARTDPVRRLPHRVDQQIFHRRRTGVVIVGNRFILQHVVDDSSVLAVPFPPLQPHFRRILDRNDPRQRIDLPDHDFVQRRLAAPGRPDRNPGQIRLRQQRQQLEHIDGERFILDHHFRGNTLLAEFPDHDGRHIVRRDVRVRRVDPVSFDRPRVDHRDLRGQPHFGDAEQLGDDPLQMLPVDKVLLPRNRLPAGLHKDLIRAVDPDFVDRRVFHRLRNRTVVGDLVDQRSFQLHQLVVAFDNRLL
ncbi:hypothetical protein D1872_220780 [compost metagenome]